MRRMGRPKAKVRGTARSPWRTPATAAYLSAMLDAVLLEWEGVLADTSVARREALLRALADEGVQYEALEADPALADLVALRATRAFAERIGKGLVLLPGVREFVERVQLGSRVAIVTSATRAETEFVLRLAGLDAAVSTIVSADDSLDGTAAYERAIAQLARVRPIKRDHVVALASTSPALRAARAAGVCTIAVGAPAHVALDADGALATIDGVTIADLTRVAGIVTMEHRG
jgi:beta-phosphoglucomutase-like phosphatase (HAD superfamily)